MFSPLKGADKGIVWYICGMPEDMQRTREFLLGSGCMPTAYC